MNRLEQLEGLAQCDPLGLARSSWQTEQQLSESQRRLAQTQARILDIQGQLSESQQRLCEALAYIVELKRQLFGSRSDKLSAEQEAQLGAVVADLEEQAQRPGPASAGVLEPASQTALKKQ